MPFGRRNKKSYYLSFINFFKHVSSFYRTKKYISLSIKRMKGSPNDLALGFASGLAISFTPFIGLHALLAIFFSWVIGGSMAAAVVGTLFGNPWTFPFIWYLTFEIGQFLHQGKSISSYNDFSFQNIKKEITTILEIIKNLFIFANIEEVKDSYNKLKVIPIMALGSIPFVIFSWITSYFIFLNILKSYKTKILKRKL